MDCNDYKNLITDYLEDKCTPVQQRQMDLHFAECENCRILAEQEKSIMEQLLEIPIEPCPDEIIDNVMNSISSRATSFKERISSWLNPGSSLRFGFASLAGSFAVVILLLFLYMPGHKKTMIETTAYSPEEIRQATTEVRLALAYFAVYSRKSETVLQKLDLSDEVIRPVEGEFIKALGKIPYI